MSDTHMRVDDLRSRWTPGDGWSWDDEERALHEFPCPCQNDPTTVTADAEPVCQTPGHYQKNLEAYLRERGCVEQPVCLGSDGRVWDGHHRIVAAHRLGFETIPVEPA